MSGPGRLEIESTHITIHGRQRALLGPGEPAVEIVATGDISDARSLGTEVRFRQRGERIEWRLEAESPGAAAEIASLLPARRSEGLDELAQAAQQFEQQLGQLEGHALISRLLLAVNVLVFLAMVVDGAGLVRANPLVHIGWGSNAGPFTMHGEWWRLFTSQFLHLGVLHLAFNMWALWNLGPLLERLLGRPRFLLLYLLSGALGGLASVLWNPAVNSVGASGAIFGLLGALLSLVMRDDLGVPEALLRAQRTAIVPFLLYNLAFGFVVPGIDNAAHLGGLLGGFLLGWTLARPMHEVAEPSGWSWQRGLGPVLATAAAAGLAALLLTPRGDLVHVQQLRRDELWLLMNESRAMVVIGRVLKEVEREQPDRPALARRLEQDAFPAWTEGARRLGRDYPLPGGPFEDERAFLREALAMRISLNAALLKWVRSGDPVDRKAFDARLRSLEAHVAARVRQLGRPVRLRTPPAPDSSRTAGSSAAVRPRQTAFDREVYQADQAAFAVFADLEANKLDARSAAERMEREVVPLWSALAETIEGSAFAGD